MAQQNINIKSENDFLEKEILSKSIFKTIMNNKDAHRIQIIYTEINRDKNNVPIFKTHAYNVNHNIYFYPASTAKMPIAFLSLQKLNKLNKKGLNKYSNMLTGDIWKNEGAVQKDILCTTGKPNIAQFIKKVFVVSDNEANNRLYEFLGQEYLNKKLHKMGYTNAQILHRLGVSLSDEDNRHTNPIRFEDINGNLIYDQLAQISKLKYLKRNDTIGNGFYKNDSLINTAFNFSTKNRLYLDDLTNILLSVLFPEKFSKKEKFNLSKDDYTFLLKHMSMFPKECQLNDIDSSQNYDAYCKFLMYGADKNIVIPNTIRIFNKIGIAYGFITDIAYFVDFGNNIEFALSATIYLNNDGIFNDDKYEYETIGFPFMKNLGKEIYDYELKRERKFKPDLKKFELDYN